MANKIQFRRGVKANLPTLSVAEPAFTTDTNELFIGTSSTNVKIAKQADVDSINASLSDVVNLNKRFNEAIISVNKSIPNTTTTIVSLDTITGVGNVTIENGSIKINETGLYIINAIAWYATNSTGVRQLRIRNKTTDYAYSIETKLAQPYFENTINATAIANIAQGSVLDLMAYQNSGGALDLVQVRVQIKKVN